MGAGEVTEGASAANTAISSSTGEAAPPLYASLVAVRTLRSTSESGVAEGLEGEGRGGPRVRQGVPACRQYPGERVRSQRRWRLDGVHAPSVPRTEGQRNAWMGQERSWTRSRKPARTLSAGQLGGPCRGVFFWGATPGFTQWREGYGSVPGCCWAGERPDGTPVPRPVRVSIAQAWANRPLDAPSEDTARRR